jgi:hypothetical protein
MSGVAHLAALIQFGHHDRLRFDSGNRPLEIYAILRPLISQQS